MREGGERERGMDGWMGGGGGGGGGKLPSRLSWGGWNAMTAIAVGQKKRKGEERKTFFFLLRWGNAENRSIVSRARAVAGPEAEAGVPSHGCS